MAENKKSFILYCDLLSMVDKLPDEISGKLFKIILQYVNDKNPVIEDLILQIAFEPIKNQLKRDLIKWEDKSVSRSETGRLGGIKSGETRRKQKEANEANALNLKQNEANEAVNVNVNVTVNDKKKDIINNIQVCEVLIYPTFDDFWNEYDKKQDRPKCETKWNKLPQGEKEKIMQHIPLYKLEQPNKKYRKNPQTYFNNRAWENEIINSNINSNGQITNNRPISIFRTPTEAG